MIRAIAALDDKRGIAAEGDAAFNIPWDIPDDRKYYKDYTRGSIVVMGRGTYESFEQPLPMRQNIVVSHSLDVVQPGFTLVSNLESYLKANQHKQVWIIGGARIYDAALPFCEELYLTHVQGDYDCNKFFPKYANDFELEWKSDAKEQNGNTFQFARYIKKPVSPR